MLFQSGSGVVKAIDVGGGRLAGSTYLGANIGHVRTLMLVKTWETFIRPI